MAGREGRGMSAFLATHACTHAHATGGEMAANGTERGFAPADGDSRRRKPGPPPLDDWRMPTQQFPPQRPTPPSRPATRLVRCDVDVERAVDHVRRFHLYAQVHVVRLGPGPARQARRRPGAGLGGFHAQ